MRRNIVVEQLKTPAMDEQKTELVERKGVGHPDSLADGIAESMSRALCKYYMKEFGSILHHNTDETQIVGGQSAPDFGGGCVLEPIYILLVGRAVTSVGKERIPFRSLTKKAAAEYLRSNCRYLDLQEDVTLDCRIGQGSVDLRGLYETRKHLSNDTSFGVGFAPFSETERIVFDTEKQINGPWRKQMKEVGEDVKVMASRKKDKINVTVACAMVDRAIPDKSHYINVVQELRSKVHDFASSLTEREVAVDVNTADNYKKNILYMTVTGLSMENGDDGSVGRGNRANGLITPYRPMSMEASSGKNPVTHVGKMYNLLSLQIAEAVVKESKGDIKEANVRILSQIGHP
ncbi:MAG: methionine adenosyltransferase, partial [Candidatus Thermoplasmatota archaeon]|nr:methionine adenosyltransferase [Candidatus Thermoplasmatota archaeon]